MKNHTLLFPLFALLLVACAPQAAGVLPAAFPVSADGSLTGSPESFLVSEAELEGDYTQSFASVQRPNEAFDYVAYIEATDRLNAAMIKFHRPATAQANSGPLYIINNVTVFASPEGALLALSPEWHSVYYDSIFESDVTEIPSLTKIGAENRVWQDSDGNVGLSVLYRNLLFYFTGPTTGPDQLQYFIDLAKTHIAWIQAREQ